MPEIPFNSGIDLQKTGQISNGRWQVLPSAPSNPVLGQQYYDSTLNKTGFWNGSKWVYGLDLQEGTGIDITNDTVSIDNSVVPLFSDLGAVATSNSYNDLDDKPTIPTVNNPTITIQKNSTPVESFTLNQTSNETINITVPTQASDVGALPDTTGINDLTSTAQQNALNSGITQALVTQIGTNQTNISTINGKIPSAATTTNQLADKQYVDNAISTNTADFDGSWATYAAIPTTVAGFTNQNLPEPSNNNYLIVLADETQDGGTWRYKYVDDGGAYNKSNWNVEYEVNESPFTQTQLDAINSGANTTNITQIGINTSDIGTLQTQISTKADAFAVTNPALTVSGGICTWNITNDIGTKNVQVSYFRESDGVEVKTYTKVTASTITASFNSTANITAGTYRAVIIGLK